MGKAEHFSRVLECRSEREWEMAKLCKVIDQRRLRARKLGGTLKFRSRYYNRCGRCGRARGYYRKFDLCRICLRMLALEGKIPGMTKSSW